MECGCKINRSAPMPHPPSSIAHCPMHAAAKDMLTALEAIVQHPLKSVQDRDGAWSAIRDGEMIRAQHAVSAAGGVVANATPRNDD